MGGAPAVDERARAQLTGRCVSFPPATGAPTCVLEMSPSAARRRPGRAAPASATDTGFAAARMAFSSYAPKVLTGCRGRGQGSQVRRQRVAGVITPAAPKFAGTHCQHAPDWTGWTSYTRISARCTGSRACIMCAHAERRASRAAHQLWREAGANGSATALLAVRRRSLCSPLLGSGLG